METTEPATLPVAKHSAPQVRDPCVVRAPRCARHGPGGACRRREGRKAGPPAPRAHSPPLRVGYLAHLLDPNQDLVPKVRGAAPRPVNAPSSLRPLRFFASFARNPDRSLHGPAHSSHSSRSSHATPPPPPSMKARRAGLDPRAHSPTLRVGYVAPLRDPKQHLAPKVRGAAPRPINTPKSLRPLRFFASFARNPDRSLPGPAHSSHSSHSSHATPPPSPAMKARRAALPSTSDGCTRRRPYGPGRTP